MQHWRVQAPAQSLDPERFMASSSMGAHMHFVVGHAQTGERLADLIGSQRAAAIPVKVRKRRRKILLLQQEHMLLVVVGVGAWLSTCKLCIDALIKYVHMALFDGTGLCGAHLLSVEPSLELALNTA